MKLDNIIWLFLVTFMIHDFEEIVFIKSFMNKNADNIMKKLPKVMVNRVNQMTKDMSTASFACAVGEIFIVSSIFTIYISEYNNYSLLISITVFNILHILMHIGQSIYVRKYIPGLVTGIVSGIYNVYLIYYFQNLNIINWGKVMVIFPFVIIGLLINLLFAHLMAKKVFKL